MEKSTRLDPPHTLTTPTVRVTGWDVYLRGLPAQQQVRGCDLVILHLGQRLLDLLQVVAHTHHHICTKERAQTAGC